MTVEQNLETVRRAYAAFSGGDMETLLSLYKDDIAHIVPGASAISGAHKGKDNVLGLYGKLFELSNGTVRVELQEVLSDGGDRAVAIHRSTIVKDGETVQQTEALLFTFVDGKISEIVDFFGDIELMDRLFS